MKRQPMILAVIIVCVFVGVSSVSAQIEENLQRYSEDNGTGYLQPLINGLGASMNRGWYQTGKVPKLGLTIKVGLVAMMAPVVDKDKTFMATTEGVFVPKTTAKASTIVGSEKSTSVTGTGGTEYVFPGGFNLDYTGFAVPQLTVGSVFGTQAVVRYFAYEVGDSEIGNIELFGIGFRHSLSQYLLVSPVHFSFGAFWQSVKLGEDLIAFDTVHLGFQASRGFGPLNIYGGLGLDQSSASIKYEFVDAQQTHTISYDMEGDDGVGITLGVGLNILPFNLTGDITFGTRTVYSLGLFFGK